MPVSHDQVMEHPRHHNTRRSPGLVSGLKSGSLFPSLQPHPPLDSPQILDSPHVLSRVPSLFVWTGSFVMVAPQMTLLTEGVRLNSRAHTHILYRNISGRWLEQTWSTIKGHHFCVEGKQMKDTKCDTSQHPLFPLSRLPVCALNTLESCGPRTHVF